MSSPIRTTLGRLGALVALALIASQAPAQEAVVVVPSVASDVATDGAPLAPARLVGPGEWSPLSEAMLARIAAGDPVTLEVPSAVTTLSTRLEGLNLAARSPDLPQACAALNALSEATSAEIEPLRSALYGRALRLGDPVLWWVPLARRDRAVLEAAARRLIDLYQFHRYYRGLDAALCHDDPQPHFILQQIGGSSRGYADVEQEALLMLTAAQRADLEQPRLEVVSSVDLGLAPERRERFFLRSLSDEDDGGLVLPTLRPLFASPVRYAMQRIAPEHDAEGAALLDSLYTELKAIRYAYALDQTWPTAFALMQRASGGRVPDLRVQDLPFSEFDTVLRGSYRDVTLISVAVDSMLMAGIEAASLTLQGLQPLPEVYYSRLLCHEGEDGTPRCEEQNPIRSQLTLRSVRAEEIRVGAAQSSRAYYQHEGRWHPVSETPRAPGLTMRTSSAGTFTVDSSDLRFLDASHFSADTYIEIADSRLAGALNLFSAEAASIYLRNLTGYPDETAQEGVAVPFGDLTLTEADVRGEISLHQVTAGRANFSKARAETLRVTGGRFGTLDLWRADFGAAFIAAHEIDALTFWYARFGALEIGPRREAPAEWVAFHDVIGNHASAERANLHHLSAQRVRLMGLRAGSMSISCISVDETLDFYGAPINDFYQNNVRADALSLEETRVDVLRIDSDSAAPLVPAEPDAAQTPAACPLTPGSAFNVIDLSGLQSRYIALEATVHQLLHARSLQAESFLFFGSDVSVQDTSVLNFRHAQLGSLIMPAHFLRNEAVSAARLDIEGAEIGAFRVFDRFWDAWPYSRQETEAGPRQVFDVAAMPEPMSLQAYETYLDTELLPALRLSPATRSAGEYPGSSYRILRASLEQAGLPALARRIAVMQNDHYAEVFAETPGSTPLTWALYRLGRVINEYGYDNGRAILWLVAIWAFGVAVLLLDRLLVCRYRLRWLPPASGAPRLRLERRETPVRPLSLSELLFLSVDRTVPTLNLDDDFSRPGQPALGQSRAQWVLLALYLQRFAAFIVVVFMLGGILDVFQ